MFDPNIPEKSTFQLPEHEGTLTFFLVGFCAVAMVIGGFATGAYLVGIGAACLLEVLGAIHFHVCRMRQLQEWQCNRILDAEFSKRNASHD